MNRIKGIMGIRFHYKHFLSALGPALVLFLVFSSCRGPGREAAAAGKKMNVKKFDGGRFKLKWKLEDDTLKIRLASSYKGYMALGMNTKPTMTGADLVVAAIDSKGKISVEDHFCKKGKTHTKDTELGGTSRIIRKSAKSKKGWTAVDIVLKASSDDANDVSIKPGNTYYFLVAASDKTSMKAVHSFYDKFKVSF
jgi:hypothetical protein